MSEKLFSVGEKLYELWSHRAKKLNNVKESGTKFLSELLIFFEIILLPKKVC